MGNEKMNGYNGRFIRVNLSQAKVSIEEPPLDYYQRYLGGRGFIVPTLLKEVPGKADPLGEENKLIFALGPLTGCPSRVGPNSVGANRPHWGYGEAGGFWAE
jgi:aldehyde:ferredoxin oxidoreductase